MKDFIIALLVLLFSCSCSVEEEPMPDLVSKDCPFPFLSGTASFLTNNQVFEAIEATARFDPHNRLTISFRAQNNEYLVFDIPEFIGSGVYTNLFPPSNRHFEATYYRIHNSELVAFRVDNQNIDEILITDYDPIEGFVSGEFEFGIEFNQTVINISQGVFEEVPIVQLELPPSGEAHYFTGGIYNSCSAAWAEITNSFQLIVYLPRTAPVEFDYIPSIKTYIGREDASPWYFHEDRWPGFNGDFPTYNDPTFYDGIRDFELENGLVSAYAVFRSNTEFETAFKDIPILVYPLEPLPGQLMMTMNEDTLYFTDISYHPYDVNAFLDTLRLTAVSDDGKKIFIEEQLYLENVNNGFMHPGFPLRMEFYDSLNQAEPSFTKIGLFGDHGDYASGFASVGFDSDSINFRGIDIPIEP